jgi:transposase-like protein
LTLDIPEKLIVNAIAQYVAGNPDFEEKVAAVTARLRAEGLWIYNVSDVAREHRVSRSLVRKWRDQGLLEFRNNKTSLSEILAISERLESAESQIKTTEKIQRNIKQLDQPRRRNRI